MVVVVPRNIESEREEVFWERKKRERGRIRVRLVERMQYLTPGEHLPRAREREKIPGESTLDTRRERREDTRKNTFREKTPGENTPGEDLERPEYTWRGPGETAVEPNLRRQVQPLQSRLA